MHLQRLIIVIASSLGIVGTFLPWYRKVAFIFFSSEKKVGLTEIEGLLFLALSVSALLFVIMVGNRNEAMTSSQRNFITVVGVLATLVTVYVYISLMPVEGYNAAIGVWWCFACGLTIFLTPQLVGRPANAVVQKNQFEPDEEDEVY